MRAPCCSRRATRATPVPRAIARVPFRKLHCIRGATRSRTACAKGVIGRSHCKIEKPALHGDTSRHEGPRRVGVRGETASVSESVSVSVSACVRSRSRSIPASSRFSLAVAAPPFIPSLAAAPARRRTRSCVDLVAGVPGAGFSLSVGLARLRREASRRAASEVVGCARPRARVRRDRGAPGRC